MFRHFPSLLQPNPISARCAFCLRATGTLSAAAQPCVLPCCNVKENSSTAAAAPRCLPGTRGPQQLQEGDFSAAHPSSKLLLRHLPCRRNPRYPISAFWQGLACSPQTKQEVALLKAATCCSLCTNTTAAQHFEPRAHSWRLQPLCCLLLLLWMLQGSRHPPEPSRHCLQTKPSEANAASCHSTSSLQ